MNNFIKQVIEEKFASKAQQRFFYAKANEKGASKKEKKKWGKWAKEFSDKTDFDKIPDKKEEIKDPNQGELQFDEIVDADGNIMSSNIPTNKNVKGTGSKSTSDEVVNSAMGMMGTFGIAGGMGRGATTLRYWAESDMSKALGYEDTLGQDEDYEDAKNHFEDELGLPDDEAEDRLEKMGYDEKLKDTDKVRLIEHPKKFIEEYIESVLKNKSKDNDIVKSDQKEFDEKSVNPILMRQLKSLKDTLKDNDLTVKDIINYLNDNE
jgi:hypothetical protein